MGLRFDIKHANWLAYLIQPDAPLPVFEGQPGEQRELIQFFLRRISDNFYSTPDTEQRFRTQVHDVINRLENVSNQWEDRAIPLNALDPLRFFLSRRLWTSLIIPSGRDSDLDDFLCSESLLRDIVGSHPGNPGLILQLEAPPPSLFSLTDIFPAFRTALAESNRWPGVLVWSMHGDSTLLPLPREGKGRAQSSLHWIFSQLEKIGGSDLGLIRSQYLKEHPDAGSSRSLVHFIHLSDIHLGSREADSRLPRIQQLIRNLSIELEGASKLIPVLSGDILESPTEENVNRARMFMDFLDNLGTEEPIIVLGNHDVRSNGCLDNNYQIAIRLPHQGARIVWLDDEKIAILCFNSVISGRLARGHIGETQLLDIGSELDRKKNWQDYTLLTTLHHHPTPVDKPDWYIKPFYERVLGSWFSATESLEDADSFIDFVESRKVAGILHGHKHIPRIGMTDGSKIPIFGCGSTVGKVTTQEGIYMSINVITLDITSRRLSGRLLAERIPGGGLIEQKRHEINYRQQ